MNVKEIVSSWLKAHGYDGLCNTDIECGCLADDLAPCGEIHEGCQAGHRKDVDKSTSCSCDGSGTNHWHICLPRPGGLEEHLRDAINWQCDCGARCHPGDANWRWNGQVWEHQHAYPGGHFPATRREEPTPVDAETVLRALEGLLRVLPAEAVADHAENQPCGGTEVCAYCQARYVVFACGKRSLDASTTLAALEALESCPVIRLGESFDEFAVRFKAWHRDVKTVAIAKAKGDPDAATDVR